MHLYISIENCTQHLLVPSTHKNELSDLVLFKQYRKFAINLYNPFRNKVDKCKSENVSGTDLELFSGGLKKTLWDGLDYIYGY